MSYWGASRVVTETLRDVARLSQADVERILQQEPALEPQLQNTYERLLYEACGDKTYCAMLDCDYLTLPKGGVDRVKVFALRLAKRGSSIVLPFL